MSEPRPEPEIRPVRSDAEFQEALAVRIRVFVDEQGGPLTDEPDAWDPEARHFLVRDGELTVGTARLYVPWPGIGKIGRVALLEGYRRRSWGGRLLAHLVDAARAMELAAVVLDAQAAAIPFYERFGFRSEGEQFMDAGIPHQRMRLELKG